MTQFLRYGTVGFANSVISAGCYAALIALGTTPALSASLAFAIGAVNGYLWNRRWTFAAAERSSPIRYVLVQGAGLAVTDLIVLLTAGVTGPFGAYAVAVCLVTVATFAANRRFTFTPSQQLHSRG